ncbi:MAG: hypothetical protein Q9M94_03885, partial [Candidatus Gracilibacteria bacterium]|nr:hypothetical protein [Candidatus Gracilibacteria bacterium]
YFWLRCCTYNENIDMNLTHLEELIQRTKWIRNNLEIKKEFEIKLEAKLLKALEHKDSKKFEIHNKAINKINKINIEYKYEKATKSMIHDGEKSQVSSMLGALRYIGLLA